MVYIFEAYSRQKMAKSFHRYGLPTTSKLKRATRLCVEADARSVDKKEILPLLQCLSLMAHLFVKSWFVRVKVVVRKVVIASFKLP
jgi:hypothetical protein